MKQFAKRVVSPPDSIEKLEITDESYPQGSAANLEYPIDLGSYGYVEEEYVIRGRADLFAWLRPDEPPYIRVEDAPYATRILVRKPKDPARFSGCVMIESFNTATGLDHASTGWGFCCNNIMASGDAWIGYTFGREGIGFDALVRFDPSRYDIGLGYPNPIPPEERKVRGFNVILDRPPNEGFPDDRQNAPEKMDFDRGLAHHVFFQIGALCRSNRADSPLRGYDVKGVFGVGVQSFNVYIAAFGDGMIAEDGSQVISGYLMFMAGPGIGLCREDDMLCPDDPRARVSNATPLIKIETSGDLRGVGGHPCWDGDGPDNRSRWYEIPGAAPTHDARPDRSTYPNRAEYIKAGVKPFEREYIPPYWNYMPRLIMAGAYRNLKDWALRGIVPPREKEYIRTSGERPDTQFILDEFGNQQGGVPCPYISVPIAVYDDLGKVVLLPKEIRNRLYRNKADYVGRVAEMAVQLAHDRWILPEAVGELIEQAESFDWDIE